MLLMEIEQQDFVVSINMFEKTPSKGRLSVLVWSFDYRAKEKPKYIEYYIPLLSKSKKTRFFFETAGFPAECTCRTWWSQPPNRLYDHGGHPLASPRV